MSPTRSQLLAGAAALASGIALAACGVETEEAGRSASVSTTPTVPASTQATPQQREQRATERRLRALPQPRAGQVTVVGPADLLIGREIIQGFNATSSTNATFSRSQDRRAFADLCAGRVDIVETSSIATDAIREACKANGLEVVEGLQLGSEGIVLATKNESDVGGDCVTVAQARDIFRAGSPYTNWSQLGFDDLTLRTTGREPGSDNFEFFASIVLGTSGATLGDLRSDYRAYSQDSRERREVTNADRLTAAERRVRRYRVRLRATTRAERRRRVMAADRAADRRVIAAINAANRRRARDRVEIRDPEGLERRNLRRVVEAKAAARRRANLAFDRELDRRAASYERRVLAGAAGIGVVGAFRFSYYELFEEQLRPLEIDFGVPATRSGQPVRLSDLTKADQRRIRGELAQQQGTSTAATTTPTTTPTTAAAPAQSQATGAQALDQLTLSGIDDLPERTADGEIIYRGPGCIFPAQITITSGAYPLTRRTFLVTTKRAIARREVQDFLRYTFDNVQSEAPNQRLVPITDQQRRDAYIAFSGRPPADQDPATTSTSTTPSSTTTSPATTTTSPTGTTTAPGSTTTTPSSTTTTTQGAPASGQAQTPATQNRSSEIPGVSSRGPAG